MSVSQTITRKILEEEVGLMGVLASSCDWLVETDYEKMVVRIEMKSLIDNEVYIVEAECANYKENPPYFEFIHPESGERGTRRCYPKGSSYFHTTPCICVQWNRKAYKAHGGPHADFDMSLWMSYRPGTTTLGDMFHLIYKEINKQDLYKGRMA